MSKHNQTNGNNGATPRTSMAHDETVQGGTDENKNETSGTRAVDGRGGSAWAGTDDLAAGHRGDSSSVSVRGRNLTHTLSADSRFPVSGGSLAPVSCEESGKAFAIGQTVRFVSKRGYHVRPDGDIAEVYAHFPAASNGGIEFWGVNITDEQSPDGRSHVATIDELSTTDEHSTTERTAPAGPRDGLSEIHGCANCGAQGERSSPKYCCADCAEEAIEPPDENPCDSGWCGDSACYRCNPWGYPR